MIFTFFAIAIALDTPQPASALKRQDRQDTIYVVRGRKHALEDFHKNVGETWTGGTRIDADSSDGVLKYWAYSDRTAVESRALMMPAILGGLQLSFEHYDETKRFPAERRKLDQIAVKCGVDADPFFVSPKRSVELTLPDGAEPKLRACLSDGVRLVAQLPISIARKSDE